MGSQAPSANNQSLSVSRSANQWAIAAALAFAGALNPLPVPLAGLHKFYVGQPLWGALYWMLGWTQIPRVACAIEGLWYVTQLHQTKVFEAGKSNSLPQDSIVTSQQTQAAAAALRELEKLRQEGLISEHEFEQNRRNLIDKLS